MHLVMTKKKNYDEALRQSLLNLMTQDSGGVDKRQDKPMQLTIIIIIWTHRLPTNIYTTQMTGVFLEIRVTLSKSAVNYDSKIYKHLNDVRWADWSYIVNLALHSSLDWLRQDFCPRVR